MNEQLQIIDLLLSKNEIKKAEVLIAKLLRADLQPDERSGLMIYRARTRLLAARPEDALDDLATVAAINPIIYEKAPTLELRGDCHLARFELASVGFADRNDTKLAEENYNKLIEHFPDYNNIGWIYYQLGRVCVTKNDIQTSIEYFQKALLGPSHVSSLTAYCYERLGFIAYYEERNPQKAAAFLNRAIDTFTAQNNRNWLIQVHILRSRVLYSLGDYETAQQVAEETLRAAGSIEGKQAQSEALLAAGEIFAEVEGHDRDVIQYLQQFLQIAKRPVGIDVTWSRVHEMLGNAYFNLGQFNSALVAYQSALQFHPDHPWALSLYYRVARCYYHQRAYENVLETIQQMQQIAKTEEQEIDDYRVYDILGNALFALKKYDQAVDAYQIALRIAPANADSLPKIQSYYDLAKELI
ncbi:MAG: tetratricopeptide repeat protein [Anaerolineae bacterium]|nr:tetratricopeptide repeat protein [Anaerolineae bacterium]